MRVALERAVCVSSPVEELVDRKTALTITPRMITRSKEAWSNHSIRVMLSSLLDIGHRPAVQMQARSRWTPTCRSDGPKSKKAVSAEECVVAPTAIAASEWFGQRCDAMISDEWRVASKSCLNRRLDPLPGTPVHLVQCIPHLITREPHFVLHSPVAQIPRIARIYGSNSNETAQPTFHIGLSSQDRATWFVSPGPLP